MRQFILGLAVGITMTASYFLLSNTEKPSQAEVDPQNVSAEQSEHPRNAHGTQEAVSENSVEPNSQEAQTKHTMLHSSSPSKQSDDPISEQENTDDTNSKLYPNEYDRALRDRVRTISERLNLSALQMIKLEKKLFEQKADLAGNRGDKLLDRMMIDEFSIGFEEELTEPQLEEFLSYKHEQVMFGATVLSKAIVAGIKESTGISNERAKKLENSLIESHFNSRMFGEYTDSLSVIKESLTPAEWEAYRKDRSKSGSQGR